jgi:hypothetical protein
VTHRRCKGNSVLIATLSLSMLAVGHSNGADPQFKLHKDRDTVFRLKDFTSTEYFHFGKDGKYRQVNREHMFTCESDRGTWKQNAAGRIELESAILRRDVKCGPLKIRVRDVEQLEALHPLKRDVGAFLAANKRDSYSRDEIERAWKYSYTWSLFDTKIAFSAVEVENHTEKVTRKQLAQLLTTWEEYLKSGVRNQFQVVAVKYHKFVLLASEDYPLIMNSPKEATEIADRFGGPDKEPAMVFVLIDSAVGIKGMKTKHPFSYLPELNQGGSEEPLRYKDTKEGKAKGAEKGSERFSERGKDN